MTLIGTNFGNTRDGFAKAFDGDLLTFIDASESGNYVGTDLGELTKVTKLRFYTRSGLAGRMTNGKFQGSNDNLIYTDFYTISSTPAGDVYTEVLVNADFRYVRYMSPDNSYCNVAEIEFYQTEGVGPSVYPVASVSLEFPSYTLKVGKTVQVNTAILPANATNKAYSFSISPSELASVNNTTGVLTGTAVGTGTITVTTQDGSKTATSTLTVNAATELKLTGTLNSTFGGAEAFDGDIATWFDNGAAGVYTGLDFGSVISINKISFYPRPYLANRMNGAKFQGSIDEITYTDIYEITATPTQDIWTEVAVNVNYGYVKICATF